MISFARMNALNKFRTVSACLGLAAFAAFVPWAPAQGAGGSGPSITLPAPARGAAAVQAIGARLPEVARRHALSPERLRKLFETDHDLWVDRAGGLLFADSHTPVEAAGADSGGIVGDPLVPTEQTFVLHSRPSATRKIYLDFTGHTATGTSWKNFYNGSSTVTTPTYDFDGNTNSFGSNELERIQYIWQRVAEDYSVFDVDVTTEDPGVEGLRKTTTGDVSFGIRVCIGGASQDWYSNNGYGGVAYIGSFSWNSDTPCYVFTKNLGNGDEKYTAEAISHEVGHSVSLYHDGTSTLGYYTGHGSGIDGWAPIMGVGYYQNTVQFSKGEYTGANNTENDFALITSHIAYIPDDHGNTFAAATQLPEGGFSVLGIIGQAADVDVFKFNAGAGTFNLSVGVDSRSPNLNVLAAVYDVNGVVIATNNPGSSLGASFALTGMPAGTYYVAIDGDGSGTPSTGYSDYGSVGQYFLSGTVPAGGVPVAAASATSTSGTIPLDVQFSSAGSLDPDGGTVTFLWNFGDSTTSTDANPLKTYTSPGNFVATLTVTDDEGLSSSATLNITVADVPPSAPVSLQATTVTSTRIDLAWTDTASNETGFQIERSTDGVNFTVLATRAANITAYSDTTVSGGVTYTYRVRATNSHGASSPSNLAAATTPTPPPNAPGFLHARSASRTQIDLTWTDNAANEAGFYVERSANGTGGWTRIATLGVNVRSYSNTGLTANTKHYYRVQSYNGTAASAYSAVASATTKR